MPAELAITITILVGLVVAYLIGAIPNGVIIGKLYAGVDVRKHGSGNIGTTNTLRLAGWVPGLIVAVLDIAKGVLGTLVMFLCLHIATTFFPDAFGNYLTYISSGWLYDLAMGLSMLITVIGHIYSPFLRFSGGKGIATSFGGFLMVVPWCILTSLAAFIVGCLITKRVSVGSLAGAIGFLIGTCTIYTSHIPLICVSVALTVLVFYAHRSNLVRLAHGEEPKFSVGSKKTAEKARKEEIEQSDSQHNHDDKQASSSNQTSKESRVKSELKSS